jgi:L-alanine-DL-glutamate epimerase-like enolase superfamily enzyme
MKITDIELIPLSVKQPNPDDCDGQYNDFVVPHGWKTAIAVAGPEPELKNGRFALPTVPGIGVELNEATVEKYRLRQ